MSGLSAGEFSPLSFQIPLAVRDALNSSATDVSFKIILNADAAVQSVLVDNLVLSDEQTSGDSDPDSERVELSYVKPDFAVLGDVFLSATQKLTIDDRCVLGAADVASILVNGGSQTTEFGAGVGIFADVASTSDVNFYDRAQPSTEMSRVPVS